MRVVIFCHSLISDWNHGNAHFLRGIATEFIARGHDVRVYEDRDAWSIQNLVALHSESAVDRFLAFYPQLKSFRYDATTLDLNHVLGEADLVLVHEWNPPELVAKIGRHRARDGEYVLLFHDTHHRAVTAPNEISQFDLSHYDGVLAFGNAVASAYLKNGWARKVWTWHEAADTRVFWGDRSHFENGYDGELVWIGNWGDEERTEELREFLLRPVKELGLKARAYGVRYPEWALKEFAAGNIEYGGWLPNFEVPRVFSRFRVTIHVPRRPYVQSLPGIPTIRVFEALACGIPLVSAFWSDEERLFSPGRDYLVAHDGREMVQHLRYVLRNVAHARELASHGQRTILARHTCSHRVDELLAIYARCLEIPRRAVA